MNGTMTKTENGINRRRSVVVRLSCSFGFNCQHAVSSLKQRGRQT